MLGLADKSSGRIWTEIFWILLGAAGLFFGTANPVRHEPFLILCYPAALYMIARYSAHPVRDAVLCGMLGAGSSLYWIAVAVHDYGSFPWPLAIPCPVLVGFYIGLWNGLFAWCLRRIFTASPCLRVGSPMETLRVCLTAALLWYLMEWLRGWVFTGFPWLTLTAAFAGIPALIQGASLIGAYGLSGVFAFCAFLLAETFTRNEAAEENPPARECLAHDPFIRRSCKKQSVFLSSFFLAFGGAGILCLLFLAGNYRLNMVDFTGKPLYISLVQGNVSQDIKWNPVFQQQTLEKYLSLSEEALPQNTFEDSYVMPKMTKPDLIVWPETAMPFYFQTPSSYREEIMTFARDNNVPMLIGGPASSRRPDGYDIYNRVYLIQNDTVSFYDKQHLVPIGEYVPPWLDLEFLKSLTQGVGGFMPGSGSQKMLLQDKNILFGVLICYEAIFPELARQRVQNGAEFFINVSNDAWYNFTSAAQQHMHLTLLRAVEQYRFLARGTNTGITAFIDPLGRVFHETELFEDVVVHGKVFRETRKTVFYHVQPFLPGISLVLLLLLLWKKQLWRRKK